MSCIFCAIVAGNAPARIVMEDDDTMAFLALGQAVAGHTLVVPKIHARDILDITPDSWTAVTRTSRAIARLIEDRLAPGGISMFQNNRVAGWQSVFHLHIHVVPRYDGDKLVVPWRERAADDQLLDDVGRKLGAEHRVP